MDADELEHGAVGPGREDQVVALLAEVDPHHLQHLVLTPILTLHFVLSTANYHIDSSFEPEQTRTNRPTQPARTNQPERPSRLRSQKEKTIT